MEEEELKDIWKKSTRNEYITVNISQLLKDFKSGMERREHIVRKRDRREIIGALLGAILFCYYGYHVSLPIARIGCILTILSYVYFIYILRKNRKSGHTHDLFLSIKEQLIHQRKFMLNQARLLSKTLLKILFLLYTAQLVVIWGMDQSEAQRLSGVLLELLPFDLREKLSWSVTFLLVYAYVIWMNKKAAKVNWEPLIKDIDLILKELKKED